MNDAEKFCRRLENSVRTSKDDDGVFWADVRSRDVQAATHVIRAAAVRKDHMHTSMFRDCPDECLRCAAGRELDASLNDLPGGADE